MTHLRLAASNEVADAVRSVLEGESGAFAPVPEGPTEASRWIEVLRPDAPVEEPDAAVVLPTSGSTGNPRAVVLSRSALVAAATAGHARLGGPGVWVCALAPHHVAGLMVHVRAHLSGIPAIVVDQHLTGLTELTLPDTPAYLSLVPTQLYRALRQNDLRTELRRYTILLGGAAADRAELERARESGIRVVTTYGMTETCGGVVYDGVPLDGVHVGLDDDGRISLTGPTTFSGYRLEPEATADVLDGRTFLTSDRGAWVGERLEVRGRIDDVVISGGVNVDLAQLQRAADRALGVERVVVLGVPDPEWGAKIVAVTTSDITLDALRDRLDGRVEREALPRDLRRLDAFPRTSSGKIDRRTLVSEWEV
ncbi:MAG TPA: AMP-binding protein [Propionibacteriaceae bacterium]|nr:AMP-binding protein [Propionibacteriaceae bacterium]